MSETKEKNVCPHCGGELTENAEKEKKRTGLIILWTIIITILVMPVPVTNYVQTTPSSLFNDNIYTETKIVFFPWLNGLFDISVKLP